MKILEFVPFLVFVNVYNFLKSPEWVLIAFDPASTLFSFETNLGFKNFDVSVPRTIFLIDGYSFSIEFSTIYWDSICCSS